MDSLSIQDDASGPVSEYGTPVGTPSAENPPALSSEMTPVRVHYLKKTLIKIQIDKELDELTTSPKDDVSTLSFLGPPFDPAPPGTEALDLPLISYIFRKYIVTFPFMTASPNDFYKKLQAFVTSVLARNLSPSSILDDGPDQHSEEATRLKMLARIERNLSIFLSASTKLVEKEEVIRLNQSDLDRLEKGKQAESQNKRQAPADVNIICVKAVTEKGRIRTKAHEEFIIRVRREGHQDLLVSRRYSDFTKLAEDLRKMYPDQAIRPPPTKDLTTASAPVATSSPPSSISEAQSFYSTENPHAAPARLSREHNRLTLRAYIHNLLTSGTVASSAVMQAFLFDNQITLSQEDMEDAARREDADRVREEGRKRFASEIATRVESLRIAVKTVKSDIMGADGLAEIFAKIRSTPNVQDLPPDFKAVLEWARISFASTLFQQFVAADNASESFASLQRINMMMPYFILKTALKVTNPVLMLRGVLEIFMAQPFGQKSLLQRMFTASLSEEVKALEEDINSLNAKVSDPVIADKIRQFVYAPKAVQDRFKQEALEENMNVIAVVLRSEGEPVLSPEQIHRVFRAYRAHAVYVQERDPNTEDKGPSDLDAWLFEDLRVLTHLYSRLRDREQLIGLIFEGKTAELLREIVTIFYTPLAQVYRSANIADSVSDLQEFVTDLIATVTVIEQSNQQDPHTTVQKIIDLVERHEQSFYSFIYRVQSKGEGLFDGLMRWAETFIKTGREGFGEKISLEFILPHGGSEREDIMREVDAVAEYHYKMKLRHEQKIHKRFARLQQGGSEADIEEEKINALVNGVVGDFQFDDLMMGDVAEVAAQETDSEDDASFAEVPHSAPGLKPLGSVSVQPPTLKHIPAMLPLFTELMRPLLV